MQSLDCELLNYLSFPDYEIYKMEISLPEKNIEIEVEGAWLDIGNGMELNGVTLIFKNWKVITISRWDPEIEEWINTNEHEIEYLKDLCEFQVCDSVVFLRGFGKNSGHWIEWKLVQPFSTVQYKK